jgi:uncharacterized protein Usg
VVKYWSPFAWTFQKGQNGITIVFAFGLPFIIYRVELWTMENNIKGLTIVEKFGKQHWELDGNQLKTIWNTSRISKIQIFLQTHLWKRKKLVLSTCMLVHFIDKWKRVLFGAWNFYYGLCCLTIFGLC